MKKLSVFKILLMDIFDFFVVFSISFAMVLGIYFLLPHTEKIPLSIYFVEQFVEIFFVNPELIFWFLLLGFGVNLIYHLVFNLLFQCTPMGHWLGLKIKMQNGQEQNLRAIILRAMGAYVSAMSGFIFAFYAWWLEPNHRGLQDKFSKTALVLKSASSQ